jgi:2-polyprenyl-3-methyl-5-hydroxy-6-metoxy-1,4-benzoquinol methylase
VHKSKNTPQTAIVFISIASVFAYTTLNFHTSTESRNFLCEVRSYTERAEMSVAVYDEHSEFYLEFVDRRLAEDRTALDLEIATITSLLGERLNGALVCDIACGEGYLGRHLVGHGARAVIGIDASEALIKEAIHRANSSKLEYRVDDAHLLSTVPDRSVDVVVSQLALMDIADHRRMFTAARRVLSDEGVFVFSVLHPCFRSPYRLPNELGYMCDQDGKPIAVMTRRYAEEGFWRTGGDGVRGRMGSYHRMLSTYINDLQMRGFRLERLEEPLPPNAGLLSQVPMVLVVVACVE